jgi:thiol:disulfide interchange protein DsbD
MDEEHLFTEIASPTELDQALADARSNGKRVMIDFYADWCVDCIKMEKSTFQDREIVQALKQDFLTLQVDVTDPNDVDRKAVKKQLGVFGPPAVLFFDRSGNPQKELDFYGYRKPTDFLALISR